ncbi:MAG: endonuclease/exonuclease/phosphatase family protein [Chloroflexota bacterium]|nr:endonuclease/exonuclease/phosphatase family protein [Chloroflexota bacterium]
MLRRLQTAVPLFTLVEAGVIGLFFIQSLRFAIGMLYGQVAGVSAAFTVDPTALTSGLATIPDVLRLNNTLALAGYMALLPLLTLLFGRIRLVTLIAAGMVIVGRALMLYDVGLTPTEAALVVVGGGLVYMLMLVRNRLRALPYFFVLGLAADQAFRAVGDTLDPSWSASFQTPQMIVCIVVAVFALLVFALERPARSDDARADQGLLSLWGALGMGGLLFIELALLALPNAVANRARTDYSIMVPILMVATLLPIVPGVRTAARRFVGLFDPNLRGWVWMLLIALLIVLGTRLSGIVAGIALALGQFFVSLLWWWLARPKAEKERSFAGLWLIFGVAVFGLLVGADNFTYEYAFVRDFAGNFAFLNDVFPPLLRGLRGLGLAVLILGVFFAVLPMTQSQRRLPWFGASALASFGALIVVVGATAFAAFAAQPPVVSVVRDDLIRIGTYNIHGGFSEFYATDLEAVASVIAQSGVQVVLMQEVEGGRMSSFGVDQTLWLARRLGMDRRFFPTNEGLQGLAVLSRIPIAYDDGTLLTSIGVQTGLQRAQIQPEPGVVITLYNTWLSPLLEIDGESASDAQIQEQVRQLDEVIAIIASHHAGGVLGRTVVGGTFHNVPDSPLAQRMRDIGFVDAFAGQPAETSATFIRTGLLPARFDYLWLRNLNRQGAGVIDNAASDHRLAFIAVQVAQN